MIAAFRWATTKITSSQYHRSALPSICSPPGVQFPSNSGNNNNNQYHTNAHDQLHVLLREGSNSGSGYANNTSRHDSPIPATTTTGDPQFRQQQQLGIQFPSNSGNSNSGNANNISCQDSPIPLINNNNEGSNSRPIRQRQQYLPPRQYPTLQPGVESIEEHSIGWRIPKTPWEAGLD